MKLTYSPGACKLACKRCGLCHNHWHQPDAYRRQRSGLDQATLVLTCGLSYTSPWKKSNFRWLAENWYCWSQTRKGRRVVAA